MSAWPYSIAYLIPLSAFVGCSLGGHWVFLTPVIFFGLLPIVDEIVPKNTENADKEDENALLENAGFNALVRGWFFTQAALVCFVMYRIATGDFSAIEMVGLVVSVGIVGGAGINVAHELMHRKEKLDKALAEALMTCVSYTHFCVEHVFGHHKHVSTPHDPATSRLGESVYPFVIRSVTGGLMSFLHIEKKLVERKKLNRWSVKDRRVRYPLILGLSYLAVSGLFGWAGLLFFIAQGIFAFTMLEVVNYLEHYGLQRIEVAPGRYGRVEPIHSWSSSHRVSNWILFGLPRHADHHARASRPYPILRHFDIAPQLPAGYTTMLLLALVPPLWRAVMDPRVEAVRAQHLPKSPSNKAPLHTLSRA
ncbi:MAG: alkane 1-monooxygenase [Myxococcota bacterium]|nr:alkane 1-monooxygenase [Myxococcota bacterium]